MSRRQAKNAEEIASESDIALESDGAGSLPAKQELALRAVLSNPTLKEAALAAGVSETTLWRYMQDAEFSRRLREMRRDAVNHAVIRLQRASSDAVTVLRDLMMKVDAPASARITAARTVLDYAIRAVEMDELKMRSDQLEEYLKMKEEENALDAASKEGNS